MPIDKLFKLLWEIVEEIHRWLRVFDWSANALLDLFLHAAWSGAASLLGLWLAYWAVRALWFVLGPRSGSEQGLSFVLSRRVVCVCILAQFMLDILGHAYAVFRQDLPVTLANLGQHSARDFHAEAWCLSLALCLVVGVYVGIRLKDALKYQTAKELPARLDGAMRWFGYAVALLASLSSHMWWDRLLSFG